MGLAGCRLFFMIDFTGMIVGIYTISILSVERCIEVLDTKRRTSQKFKNFLTGLCLIVIWLFAVVFSLPIVLSFESNILHNGSFTCEMTWTDQKTNAFFIVKYLLIFIVPFTIILVSSTKLLIFLVKWQRKMSNSKPTITTNESSRAFGTGLIFRIFFLFLDIFI